MSTHNLKIISSISFFQGSSICFRMQKRLALPLLVLGSLTLILSPSVQGGFIGNLAGSVGETLTSATSGAGDTVTAAASAAGDTVSSMGSTAGDTVGSLGSGAEETVSASWGSAQNVVGDALGIRNANAPRYIKDYNSRTVGGEIAKRGEFGHQVQILRSGELYCGGALLNNRWVLTTASCAIFRSLSFLTVAANKLSTAVDEEERQERNILFTELHPDYRQNGFLNDIALLRMSVPFELTDDLVPIELALEDYTPADGSNGTVTGWGSSTNAEDQPLKLHKVQVPFVSDTTCNSAYQSTGDSVVDSMVCAGSTGNNPCQGDSGGPLIVKDADIGMRLVGILSWGQGCGQAGYPAVYTEVRKYSEWIMDKITQG